jgi:hypothetical protein
MNSQEFEVYISNMLKAVPCKITSIDPSATMYPV